MRKGRAEQMRLGTMADLTADISPRNANALPA